jgi:hypothetical protein
VATIIAGAGLLSAAPASASLPPAEGTSYTKVGCSAWKSGGLLHTSPRDPTAVQHYDVVRVITCLYRSGLKMYARTLWYLPSGGKVVGSVFANVRNCTTGQQGSGTLDGYNNVAGPTTSSTAWSTYSPQYTAVSGNYYQAKGYIGGQAQVGPVAYNLDDDWNKPNVNVASSCYKIS